MHDISAQVVAVNDGGVGDLALGDVELLDAFLEGEELSITYRIEREQDSV